MGWKRFSNGKNQNQNLAVGVGMVGVSVAAATIGYMLVRSSNSYGRHGLTPQRWRESVDDDGRVLDFVEVLLDISDKSLDSTIRRDLWPYLLGLYSPKSSAAQREAQLEALHLAYNQLVEQAEELHDKLDETLKTEGEHGPIPAHLAQFAEAHRIIVMDAVRTNFKNHESIMEEPSVVRHIMSNIPIEKAIPNSWAASQWTKGLWVSSTTRDALDHTQFITEQKRQAARLVSLLTAYALHDPEVGYCQGMSDLAVPFILLFPDDAEAFWCFEHLMKRARRNFAVDESGIYSQLQQLMKIVERKDAPLFHRLRQIGAADCHFVYRMIVVLMKRDLPTVAQVLQLWEQLWADSMLLRLGKHPQLHDDCAETTTPSTTPADMVSPPTPSTTPEEYDLFIYFIAAVVMSQRRRVLDDCHDNDDVLKHFNKATVNVWECLRTARQLRKELVAPLAESAAKQA